MWKDFVLDASPQRQRQRETTAEQRSLRTLEDGKPTDRRCLPYQGRFPREASLEALLGVQGVGLQSSSSLKMTRRQADGSRAASHSGPPAPLPHPIPHTLHTEHTCPSAVRSPKVNPSRCCPPLWSQGHPAVEGVPQEDEPHHRGGPGRGPGAKLPPRDLPGRPIPGCGPKGREAGPGLMLQAVHLCLPSNSEACRRWYRSRCPVGRWQGHLGPPVRSLSLMWP